MKIAILSAYFGTNIGGAEVSTQLFVDQLMKKKLDVSIITANHNANPGSITTGIFSNSKHSKLNLSKIPFFKHYPTPFLVFDLKLVDFIIYIQIKKILSNIKPDLLHIQDFELSYPAVRAAKSLGIKTLITVRDHRFICNLPMFDSHGNPQKIYTKKDYIKKLKEISNQRYNSKALSYFIYPFLKKKSSRFRYALNNVNQIVTVSKYMKNLITDSGISKNIKVIYNLGPEIKLNKGIYTEKKHRDVVLFASGRLEEYKGFHVLLNAFAVVLASSHDKHASPNNNDSLNKHTKHTHFNNHLIHDKKINLKNEIMLVIAGDGTYSSELKRLALKLGILPNVKFLGKLSLSKIYEQYIKSDIIILPSLWGEPLSRVIWESFYFKKPLIAADTGGTKEIVKEKVTGMLIPPNDAAALAKAIEILIRNKKLRDKISSNSHRFILRHNKTQLNAYLKIYDESCRA